MKLSKEELQQLIDTYRSELRMLSYRQKQVTDTLNDLEKEERQVTPKKRAARAAKRAKATRKAASAKRGRKAAKKTAKKTAKKAAKKSARKAAKKSAKKASKKAAKRGRKATKKAAKRGRKPAKKAAKRAGRRPAKKAAKKATGRGYRLNAWDEIVLKTLGRKKVGVFADFLSAAKKTAAGKKLSDKALYARINQSLHKLANKRGTLKKVDHEGRGFGYTLA